jgi:hypothetical protein
MATLYFNAAVDSDWSTLGNWWMDSGFTAPAADLPTSADSVVASVTLVLGGPRTVVNFAMTDGTINGTLTVTGICTFGGQYSSAEGVINGDCVFNDESIVSNSSTINGDCTFNDSSFISGGSDTVNGDCVFNDNSYTYGTITGDCIFNDNSYAYGTITGNCIFNHSSINYGTITGDCIFNHSSINYDTITGDCIFNDSSWNSNTINGYAIFNDSSYFLTFALFGVTPDFQNRTPYPIPRGINGSSILGVI